MKYTYAMNTTFLNTTEPINASGPVGQIPTKPHTKKAVLVGIMALIGLCLIAGIYYFFTAVRPNHLPPLQARGEVVIVAEQKDSTGIDPATHFTVGTIKEVDTEQLKKAISINPPVDFALKKEPKRTAGTFDLIRRALAQGDLRELAYTYTLTPATTLNPDTVYALAVHDSAIASDDYSFAFQVRSGFKITATHPRDKVAQIPVNTGIEITFNRFELKDPEKFITIEPAVKGSFSVRRDTVVFVPEKLNPGTIYTIHVSKDLQTVGSAETLGQDYSFAFETADINQREGSVAYFNFGREVVDILPGKKPVLSFYATNIADNQFQASLYRVKSVDDFTDSYIKSRTWDLGWSYYYNRTGQLNVNPDESLKVASFDPTVVTDGYQKYLELPESLTEGFYLFKVQAKGLTRWAWLQVTPFDYYFTLSQERGLVWLYDNTSRQPVSGADIALMQTGGQSVNIKKTDDQGLVDFPLPPSLLATTAVPKFFEINKGNSTRAILIRDRWGYGSGIASGDGYWDSLRTDRYVYQLSDKINYWGIIKGRSEDLRQQKVTVALYPGYFYGFYDTWGSPSDSSKALVKQEVMISGYDTIEGQLNFTGVAPGTYQVVVLQGEKVLSQRSIEIQAFSKPAYQIMVTPSKHVAFADEELKFDVKAELFDGTPAANVELKYDFYWAGNQSGRIKLDNRGEGVIRFTPAYIPESPEGYDGYPRSLTLNINAVKAEEGSIYADSNVWVFGPKVLLQVSGQDTGGETRTLTAKVNNVTLGDGSQEYSYNSNEFIGGPAVNKTVKAQVIKRTYIKQETGQHYDPVYKLTYKTYNYTFRDDVIRRETGTTNSAGEWSLVQSFPKEDMVTYFVKMETADSQGKVDYANYSIWNFDTNNPAPSTVELQFSGQTANNEKAFALNSPIDIQVKRVGVANDQPVLWYRYQNSLTASGVIKNNSIIDKFVDSYAPNIRYRAVVYGQQGFSESQELGAVLQTADKTLDISITSDKASYRPKETVNLTVAVKDKNNVGGIAELNIAAVDEALFHVLPEYWQENLASSLYRKIYVTPLTGWSRLDTSRQDLSGAEKGGCFTGDTPIIMADGKKKKIQDINPGDMIATFASDQNHNIETAVVQGVSSHQVADYLIINRELKVTREHPLYINNQWTVAGAAKLGDELLRADGSYVGITSIKQVKAPGTWVYNMTVGTYHTYLADGFYAHNAEKGGSPRADFVDAPLFRSLRTDSTGTAKLSFQAPDNITSWRVTALAYQSQSISAGEQSKLIPVTLPFFVDVVSSPTFLTGDQPQITARLFGTAYDSNKPIDLSANSSSLNLQTGQTTIAQFSRIPLGRMVAGEHEVTVRAQQGKLADAVTRKINVVDSYFKTVVASNYLLTNPDIKVKGNDKGFTTIKFVDQGKGKYFYPLYYRSTPSIRLDDTAASILASDILHSDFDQLETDRSNVLNYQLENGGLAQFIYSSADTAVSALVADAIPDRFGQEALVGYFQDQLRTQDVDGIVRLQALYGLASLKQPVLTELQTIDSSRLDFDHSLYLALALAKAGDWESARTIYRTTIRPALTFVDDQAWLTNQKDGDLQAKKTALVAVLAGHIRERDDIDDLWRYIDSHNPTSDRDSLEEVVVLRDLLTMTTPKLASLTYTAGTKKDTFELRPGESKTIRLTPEELKALTFSGISGEPMAISYYDNYGKPEDIKQDSSISLTRTYSVDGRETNTWSEGDIVKITLRPRVKKSVNNGYQITDFLPSGIVPITNTYQRGLGGSADPCDSTWYPMTILQNSISFTYHYWEQAPKCSDMRINYYARVVTPGSYRANPAVMQSNEIGTSITLTKENRVEIK